MDPLKPVFVTLNQALARVNAPPLSELEVDILATAWHQETYASLANRLYLSEGHIRDVAADLWQRLSQALQRRVTKKTLRRVVEQLAIAPPVNSLANPSNLSVIDWGDAPAVSFFVGRQDALDTLKQWTITDRCRLIALLGMGGMGKTNLMAKLGEAIQGQFEFVIWRSLINAPPLETLLADLTTVLLPEAAIASPATPDAQSNLLLNHLRHHRGLILLDNAETLLLGGNQPGQYAPGYDAYDRFLYQMGTVGHQSCLVLTSRENLPAIARLAGRDRPTRTFELLGLDPDNSRQLLQHTAQINASEADWQALLALYQGHPLALELTARHIEAVFLGDVAAFLATGQSAFQDVSQLLQWHIDRLSVAAQEVITWLAIHRDPMTVSDLQTCILHPQRQRDLPDVLQSLRRQLPLTVSGGQGSDRGFTLPPVLLDYVTEQLILQITQALLTGDLAALDQFSLMQATAPDYRRQTQMRVIVQPILQRWAADLAPGQSLKQHCCDRLQQLKAMPLSGYAGGNLINFLVGLGVNLSHQDFADLTLREAYLQGSELRKTNFSHVHFDRVSFTQAIKGIMAVAVSAEAGLTAASDSDGVIHGYDTQTGQPRFTINGGPVQTWIYALAFAPKGETLLSGGIDKTLRLWHSQSGELLRCWQGACQILAVAYHPDGIHFASAGGDTHIYLWRVDATQPIAILRGHGGWVWSVAFSPDGTWLASSGDDGTIRLWESGVPPVQDIQDQQIQEKQVLHGHRNRVQAVTISPDGQHIASAGDDYTVKLWDSQTGTLRASLEGHHHVVRSVAFHGAGQWLVSAGYDGTIKLWDVAQQVCLKTFHSDGINRLDAIALDSRRDRLVAGSKDQTLQLWDINTGQCAKALQGFVRGTTSLAFSAEGRTLASSGLDHFVWLWDWPTGRCLKQFKGHQSNVWAVALSADGRTLASGSYDCTLKLWDVASGKCLHTGQGHRHFVRSVAFSPLGGQVASASSDGTLKLWRVETGQCLKTLTGHGDKVQQVLFTADGQQLVSSGNDGTIKVWDLETGQIMASLASGGGKVSAIALHPRLPQLISGSSDGQLRRWHLQTGQCLAAWPAHQNWIWSVAFSPGGEWVASSSDDKTVKLWDGVTGECLYSFEHPVSVGAVTFSPDGQSLVCGCLSAHLQIYDPRTGQHLKTLSIPRPLEGMTLEGATGLTPTQLATLKVLGAQG